MNNSIVSLILICLFFIAQNCISEELVVIAKNEFEPMSYEKNGYMTGISYDVFSSILDAAKIDLKLKNVKSIPWKRAIFYMQSDSIDVLIGVKDSEAYPDNYTSIHPLYEAAYTLFYRKDNPVTFQRMGEYKGSISASVAPTILNDIGIDYSKLNIVKSREQSIKMLLHGRVDYFIAPLLPTIRHLSMHFGESMDSISFIEKPITVAKIHIIYSKSSRLLKYKDLIEDELLKIAEKDLVSNLIGSEISRWDSFSWYLDNLRK